MQEKQTLMESLGFENDPNYIGLSPPEQKEKAYDKWLLDPNFCNADELTKAREHRYVNYLMTPQEEAKFEEDLQKKVSGSSGFLNV
jgi:hypothetical protein